MERLRAGQRVRYRSSPKQRRSGWPSAFSPGGRLLQVEYARECPMGAPLAIALRFRGGVFLAKGQTVRPELGHRTPSVWSVTRETAYVANGNLGDLFYLRDAVADARARSFPAVARAIRTVLHQHALRLDVRPLAAMVLLGSVEKGRPWPILGFDVTGSQWEAGAWAIGAGDLEARDRLTTSWKPDIRLPEAEALARRTYGRQRFVSTVLRAGRQGS